jgi:hypothetical protein
MGGEKATMFGSSCYEAASAVEIKGIAWFWAK